MDLSSNLTQPKQLRVQTLRVPWGPGEPPGGAPPGRWGEFAWGHSESPEARMKLFNPAHRLLSSPLKQLKTCL